MNTIPLINNAPSTNFSMNKLNAVDKSGVRSAPVNDAQLRQEVNTSIVALKREAFSLETLINKAAQELTNLNNRIAAIEQAEGDYVKKSDVVDTVSSGNMNPVTSNAVDGAISALDVASVGGSGKYISAISEADGKISATASNLATSVASGNNNPITSDTVFLLRKGLFYDTGLMTLNDNEQKTVTLSASRMYLYINIHAVSGQELVILNCYNGVLKQTRITHAYDGNDTIITNSGQNVTFKAVTGCRGHLLLLTDYSST